MLDSTPLPSPSIEATFLLPDLRIMDRIDVACPRVTLLLMAM